MSFPKVLIFGQPFNDFSGGGITLANLFRGWPKDKIAVAFLGHGLQNVTTDVCDTYYQLGSEEHKWIFPLNLVQRKFKSGVRFFGDEAKKVPVNFVRKGGRQRFVTRIFYPFLQQIGLFHSATRISVSVKFEDWVKEFRPELLYLQPSTRETIRFSGDLCDLLKIPAVIHIMDDWPSAVSSKGLFKNYWKKKIDKEFRELLEKASAHLSISEAMSEEYLERYNKKFLAFNNPIDIERWMPFRKTDYSVDPRNIKLLYSGRIGDKGIIDSLFEIADAIDRIETEEFVITLHIQTPTRDASILRKLKEFKCVVINPFAAYDLIPEIFASADILILANDFSTHGIDYLKLSMPTKAPEYMVSGTPVLVYASEQTAIAGFFVKNKCGFCVTRQSREELQNAILSLLVKKELREELGKKAVSLANEKFDSLKVRSKFQNLLKSFSDKIESADLLTGS